VEEDAAAAGTVAATILASESVRGLAPAALTFCDFVGVVVEELEKNPWSVWHDLGVLGVEECLGEAAVLPPAKGGAPFFECVFDYIYFTPSHFELEAVREPMVSEWA
jgi:hypothetical protein